MGLSVLQAEKRSRLLSSGMPSGLSGSKSMPTRVLREDFCGRARMGENKNSQGRAQMRDSSGGLQEEAAKCRISVQLPA